MDGVKPWQLAVIIIGLVGGLGLLGWQIFGGEKIHTPSSIMLMDVVTGDRFVADVTGRRSIFLPEKNPDTGKYTLVTISKTDDGSWIAKGAETITEISRDQFNAIASVENPVATPSDAKPKPLRGK